MRILDKRGAPLDAYPETDSNVTTTPCLLKRAPFAYLKTLFYTIDLIFLELSVMQGSILINIIGT
jgi:hypothetical protein